MKTMKTDSDLHIWDLFVSAREQVESLAQLDDPEQITKAHELVDALQSLIARSWIEPADPEVDELEPEEVPGGGEDDDDLGDDFATVEEISAAVERLDERNTLTFVAEFHGDLRHFALFTRPGGFILYQNDRTRLLTADQLGDEIGQVVWANLTAYKLGHGWRVTDVLAAIARASASAAEVE